MRSLVGFLLIALFLGLSSCGGAGMPASAPSPLLGKPLPSVPGRTLDGGQIEPESLGQRPVVIKFFAEYCEPCKRTLPAAQALSQDRPDVAFIGISEDESIGTAQSIQRAYGLTFPIIHDRDNAIAGRFRVTEIPATFVVDRVGNVVWVGGPDQSEADLARALDAVSD